MTRFLSTTIVAAGFALVAVGAQANVTVNFETGYSDNQLLGDNEVLLDSAGLPSIVSIFTKGDNTMSVEASGDADDDPLDADTPPDGFVNDPLGKNPDDTETVPFPPPGLQEFFLRNTVALSGDLPEALFTLNFSKAVTSATGEIWDIDGTSSTATEKWDVVAHLVGGGLVTQTSPLGDTNDESSLDGLPWQFSFSGAGQNAITSIDFVWKGGKTQGIGVAFDNLTVSPVPIPAAGLVLLGALGGLAAYRRRQAA